MIRPCWLSIIERKSDALHALVEKFKKKPRDSLPDTVFKDRLPFLKERSDAFFGGIGAGDLAESAIPYFQGCFQVIDSRCFFYGIGGNGNGFPAQRLLTGQRLLGKRHFWNING